MSSIPQEFHCFNYFLEAAQIFQSRYPDVSDLMCKCFSDSCQDVVDNGQASPEAEQYLAEFNDNHTNPPPEAIPHAKQIADNYFNILSKQYNAGKFSPTLAKQLNLISIIYAILDTPEDLERLQQCKMMRKSVLAILNGGTENPAPAAPPEFSPPAASPTIPNQPPVFTPPTASQTIPNQPPVFTPPTSSQKVPNQPPVFTPPTSTQTISNQPNQLNGPPVFTPPTASQAIPNQPPVFTPPTASQKIPNQSGAFGGPPVFTPTQNIPNAPTYGGPPSYSSPPVFTPPTSTNTNVQPPSFNQSFSNINQQQQFQQNAPQYGNFTPAAPSQTQHLQQTQNFDQAAAMSLLNSLGYTLINSSMYPALNSTTYSAIQTYLDYAINSLKNNDNQQGLSFLQSAFKTWTTGSL